MKRIIVIFIGLLICNFITAQISNGQGLEVTYGSNMLDEGKQVFVHNGYSYVFGNSGALTVNGDVNTVLGNGDVFVTLYDSVGGYKTTKFFGGGASDRLVKVIEDDFGFWMILNSYSSIEGTRTIPNTCLSSGANNDLYIVRLNWKLQQINDYSFCPYAFTFPGSGFKKLRMQNFNDVAYNYNTKQFQFSLQMVADSVVGMTTYVKYFTALFLVDTTGVLVNRNIVSKSGWDGINSTHYKMKSNKILVESDSISLLCGAKTFTYTAYYSGSPYTAYRGFSSLTRLNVLTGSMKTFYYSSNYSEGVIKDAIYKSGKIYLYIEDIPLSSNTINYNSLYFSSMPPGVYTNRSATAKAPTDKKDVWCVVLDSVTKSPMLQYSLGTNNDTELSKAFVYENDIYLGMSSKGGVAFSKTTANNGGFDYWLCRLDNNNLVQSEINKGGSLDDNINDFYIKDGITLMTGKSKSSSGFDKTLASRDGNVYGDSWTIGLCRTPIINILADNLFPAAGDLVSFTNSSKNASVFYWDFVDGTYSYLNEPKHYYNTPGIYDVKVYATSLGVCFTYSIFPNYINVSNYIIGIREFEKNKDLSVFPNPAWEWIVINPKYNNSDFIIINTIGEVVKTGVVLGEIVVSDLANGIYTIKIRNRNNEFTTKFIKE